MTIRIKCTTTFDITATNERRQGRSSDPGINRRRNQQRNWETINQLISLRTLPENITDPVHDPMLGVWSFSFDVPDPSAITDLQALDMLEHDCQGVPMILGLNEYNDHSPILVVDGDGTNLWFEFDAGK